VTALAAGRGLSEPGRGWLLPLLYPVAAAIVALFIAYPVAQLLAHAAESDGRTWFAPLARVLSEPYNRQAIYNTMLLGLTVAVLGTILAALYAYAMTASRCRASPSGTSSRSCRPSRRRF
jgi:ABC-type Fe3+ transport system permease subunit